MTEKEPTPEEKDIARIQGKLDKAPKGSRLQANLKLRVAVQTAELGDDEAKCKTLCAEARRVHGEEIAALEAKAAAEAAAKAAAEAKASGTPVPVAS